MSAWREPASRGLIQRRESIAWFVLLGLVTAGMVAIRSGLNEAHVTLAYLLIVQGGSARGGRPLGFALATVSFLCFDAFFLPPFGTLTIQDPLNWLVLLAFLATSILSAQLLYRARAEADDARERAAEIDRLAALGAETLNIGRAEDALTAIVSVIRSSLRVDACAVYTKHEASRSWRIASRAGEIDSASLDERVVQWVVVQGETVVGLPDESFAATSSDVLLASSNRPTTPITVFRPLRARGATVGVLRVTDSRGLGLAPAQLRVLDALAYYAALGVERVRLAAEAERAASLQESHKIKDAVLASVSHDLRTPLTTIKALAHELASGGDDRAEVIEDEADRLNTFVAQMLDLSRIAAGGAANDIQANEAEDLLGAAAQQVSGRLAGRELHIHVDNDEALLFGRFDFSQTLRALVNLIENAAKYSPPDVAIDLSARRDGPWLAFSVADRGPGVPVDQRERIFEPFYRQPNGPPDVGGAGLGLSIARGLVVAQGGSMSLEDRAGGGSVFTIRVPGLATEELARLEGSSLGEFTRASSRC